MLIPEPGQLDSLADSRYWQLKGLKRDMKPSRSELFENTALFSCFESLEKNPRQGHVVAIKVEPQELRRAKGL